jgi:hypothetical protein
MCDQSLHVNKLPNHWCAASCAIKPCGSPSRMPRSSRSIVSVKVVAEMFSMPPKGKFSTQAWLYFGYG